MTPARLAKYKATLACRQLDLTIITDQVNKHQNIAALIRTCDAVGIHSAHVVTPMDNMDNMDNMHYEHDGSTQRHRPWQSAVGEHSFP